MVTTLPTARATLAIDATVILLTSSLSVNIDAPAKGRGRVLQNGRTLGRGLSYLFRGWRRSVDGCGAARLGGRRAGGKGCDGGDRATSRSPGWRGRAADLFLNPGDVGPHSLCRGCFRLRRGRDRRDRRGVRLLPASDPAVLDRSVTVHAANMDWPQKRWPQSPPIPPCSTTPQFSSISSVAGAPSTSSSSACSPPCCGQSDPDG